MPKLSLKKIGSRYEIAREGARLLSAEEGVLPIEAPGENATSQCSKTESKRFHFFF